MAACQRITGNNLVLWTDPWIQDSSDESDKPRIIRRLVPDWPLWPRIELTRVVVIKGICCEVLSSGTLEPQRQKGSSGWKMKSFHSRPGLTNVLCSLQSRFESLSSLRFWFARDSQSTRILSNLSDSPGIGNFTFVRCSLIWVALLPVSQLIRC